MICIYPPAPFLETLSSISDSKTPTNPSSGGTPNSPKTASILSPHLSYLPKAALNFSPIPIFALKLSAFLLRKTFSFPFPTAISSGPSLSSMLSQISALLPVNLHAFLLLNLLIPSLQSKAIPLAKSSSKGSTSPHLFQALLFSTSCSNTP